MTNRLLNTMVKTTVRKAQSDGFYMAPSATRVGHRPHRVTVLNGRAVACTCEGFTYRPGLNCYHISDFNALADVVTKD
jgi:hypothetical protein